MKTIIAISLLLLFIVISSCQQKVENKIPSKKVIQTTQKTPINFVGQWMNEGKREDLLRNYARTFEFEHQHIPVNISFPEEIGYKKHSAQDAAAFNIGQMTSENPEWDIILINGDYNLLAAELNDPDWPRKYLADFSQIPGFVDNISDKVDLEKVLKRWHGVIPGPFLEGQYWAVWVNKKVAEKIGIEVKQFGMTVSDFTSYLKALDTYNKKNGEEIIPILEAGDWRTCYSIAVHIFMSALESPEYLHGTHNLEHRLNAWYKTLNVLEQIAQYVHFPDGWESKSWADINLGTMEGESLFFVSGSWMYNIWLQNDIEKTFDCMPVEYPVLNPVNSYPSGYICMWGVVKNSPNKDEAIKFLVDMNQPSMSQKWTNYTKCPSGIKNNISDANFGIDQFESFANHVAETYGSNNYEQLGMQTFLFNESGITTKEYFDEVFYEKMKASVAINNMKNDPLIIEALNNIQNKL